MNFCFNLGGFVMHFVVYVWNFVVSSCFSSDLKILLRNSFGSVVFSDESV